MVRGCFLAGAAKLNAVSGVSIAPPVEVGPNWFSWD